MKKLVLVLLAVVLVAAAALGIFIATFDANRYRSLVVEKASQALGAPVELGRLSLTWKNGVAVRVQNFAVYTDETKKTKSLLLPDASLVVRLMPLLKKEVRIVSVSLTDPAVRLVKGADGSIKLPGANIPSASSPSAPGASKDAGASSMLLSVGSFAMKNGRVDFTDESPANPFFVSVRQIDVKVKNFSLTKPFAFDASAAAFSAKQNLHVEGLVRLPSGPQKGYAEKVSFRTGLADWDLEALSKAVPAVRSAGLEGNLGGKLDAEIRRMDFDPQAMKELEAAVKLQNGALKLRDIKSPFERVQLAAHVSGGDLNIENFSANFAQGTLKASGTVKEFQKQALSDLRFAATDLAIGELVPEGARNAPHLTGHVSLEFAGQAAGMGWPQISRTLSGQGRFGLKDGVLLNYNLLREVIQKISIIPGAEGVLQSQLPGLYKAKLGEPSTIFQPIDLPFAVQNGVVGFNQLTLVTDVMLLQGAGQVGLADKAISARMDLVMSKELSGIIVGLIPQVQALLNIESQIQIPMQVQGNLPQVMVLPDKEFLTQKLLGAAAQQFVASQVSNLLDKPAAAREAGENTVQDLLSSKDGLKNLLQQAVGQAEPAGEQKQ